MGFGLGFGAGAGAAVVTGAGTIQRTVLTRTADARCAMEGAAPCGPLPAVGETASAVGVAMALSEGAPGHCNGMPPASKTRCVPSTTATNVANIGQRGEADGGRF